MQLFLVDHQTSEDLNIFESLSNTRSIISYYDYTTTIGGRDKLREIFKNPIVDINEIEYRKRTVSDLIRNNIVFNFNKESIDFIDFYLRQSDSPKSFSILSAVINSLNHTFSPDQEHYLKRRGVSEVLAIIIYLNNHLSQIPDENLAGSLERAQLIIREISSNKTLQRYLNRKSDRLLNFDIERCDFLIRGLFIEKIRRLLNTIYEIDMFNSVAQATHRHNLIFPSFEASGEPRIKLEGVFHLFIKNPVPNNFYLDSKKNVCLITGVNMAGKSTIIKSIGAALYLAHLGFPVPAVKMTTTLFSGLLTTINLKDDLAKGTSHFFNEVERVRYISNLLCQTSNLLVIFDELFRGTNVKDALDSSLSIIEKFTQIDDSLFIISTHIVEVANTLETCENKVRFYRLEMLMINGRPAYSYKIFQGITDDRLGFWILQNQGVLELLQLKIDTLKAKSGPQFKDI